MVLSAANFSSSFNCTAVTKPAPIRRSSAGTSRSAAAASMELAVDPAFATYIRSKIKVLREAHESLSELSKRPAPTTAHETLYFSGWH